jgi:hypothetical protein
MSDLANAFNAFETERTGKNAVRLFHFHHYAPRNERFTDAQTALLNEAYQLVWGK